MTVNELIEELRKYPPGLRVTIFDTDYSYYREDFRLRAFDDDLTINVCDYSSPDRGRENDDV